MSCNSALYAANTTAQTTTAGTAINWGVPVRRFGQNINQAATVVTLTGAGYYEILANITAVAGAAGAITVTLYQDGVAIPGAVQSVTSAAAGDAFSLTVPAIARLKCCCDSAITAVITGAGVGSVSNAAISVEKI